VTGDALSWGTSTCCRPRCSWLSPEAVAVAAWSASLAVAAAVLVAKMSSIVGLAASEGEASATVLEEGVVEAVAVALTSGRGG
jgi:hypothetical protein